MTAPITADDVKSIFEATTGRLIAENQARTDAAVKAMRDEVLADLETRGRGRIIDAIRTVKAEDGVDGVNFDPKAEIGMGAARFIRAFALGLKNKTSPLDTAKAFAKSDKGFEHVVKALEAQDAASAGFLVPEVVSEEIIDILRAQIVVSASGAASVPMPNGSLEMRYQETTSEGSYGGERDLIAETGPTLARLKMTAKKLRARVVISNDLLKFSNGRANAFVRDDLIKSLSVRADLAMLRDDGTINTPKGLRWLAPADNVVDRTLDAAAVTLETVTNDLAAAAERLESGNIPMRRPGWIMAPRTYWFLFKLRDGNGNQVFRPELSTGMLFGMPVRRSTQVPTTLGTGGDESEIYLVDFDSIMIGSVGGIELASSDTGDGFKYDETHVRAIVQHDINARHRGAEISIIKSVDWLAA